jgi:hypothetical protein
MGENKVNEITEEVFQSAIAIVKNMPKEGKNDVLLNRKHSI